jgi:hypothetical protein
MTNVEKLEAKIARHEAKIEKKSAQISRYINAEKFVEISRDMYALSRVEKRRYFHAADVLRAMGIPNNDEYYWNCCDIYNSIEEIARAKRAAKDAKIRQLIDCPAIDNFLECWRKSFIEWAKQDETFKYNSVEQIEEIAAQEVINKKLDLVCRIEAVAGKIVDAKYLEIGKNGSLNGRVIGEKKSVYVNTILAGGPIQRLHYRVLVK